MTWYTRKDNSAMNKVAHSRKTTVAISANSSNQIVNNLHQGVQAKHNDRQ